MEKQAHLEQGKQQLKERLVRAGKATNEVFDLMKIPVEFLYRESLVEIGAQEAYIDELKDELKSLRSENKSLKSRVEQLTALCTDHRLQLRGDERIKKLKAKNEELTNRYHILKRNNAELVMRFVALESELKQLRELVAQASE